MPPVLRPLLALALLLATSTLAAQGPAEAPAPAPEARASLLPDQPRWSAKGQGGFPRFVLGEDSIYVRHEDALKRLDLADGSEFWSLPLEGVPLREEDGLLFMLTPKHEVACVEARTGAVLWRTAVEKEGEANFGRGNVVVVQEGFKGPVLAGDRVLIGTFGGAFLKGRTGKLYALDRKDGKLLWSFEAEDGVEAAPLIHKELALIGGVAACYGIDLATGRQVWKAKVRSDNQWQFKLEGDTLLVSSGHYGSQQSMFGGTLYALDAATGRERWTYDICGPSILKVAGDRLVGIEWGSFGGTRLSCLGLADGKKVWELKEKGTAWPVVHEGRAVFLSKENRAHVVDVASGRPVAALPATGDFQMGFLKGPWSRFLDPLVVQGRAVVGSWDKARKESILQILDLQGGKVAEERRFPGEIYGLWDRRGFLLALLRGSDDTYTFQVYGR